MFDKFYKNIYFLGLKSGYLIRDFFRFIGKKITVPLKAIGAFFFAAYLLLDRTVFGQIRRMLRECKALFLDMKRAHKNLRDTRKHDPQYMKKLYKYYVKQAFSRHRRILTAAVNFCLPIFMFILLCSTIGHYRAQTLALEVQYNNSVIGYVQSEQDFYDAQNMVQERLSAVSKVEQKADSAASEKVSFAVKPVKRSEIHDANVLCEEMLRRSNQKTTNACGVYIDDNFLCAVKNETDATTVFDSILQNYKTDNENDVVGFVEKIAYVQGLYPDTKETVWDAGQLSDRLNSKKEAAEYYTCLPGDTLSGIASKFGIKMADLKALNPGLTENIHIGDKLLVSREVSYIQVKVTKTEKRTVSIPFQSEKEENKKLYAGQKRVKQKGQNGEELITELVTYVDGVRVSSKEISRVTTKQPVNEITQVGTKKSSGYAGGPVGPYNTTSYGGRFIWPTVGAYNISSPFGRRWGRMHTGIDIVKPGGKSTGTLIVAAGSGRVIKAGSNGAYGNCVIIDHGDGVQTLYAHMLDGSIKVRVGQKVSTGQAIGNIGSTGRVSGPHLHFEVRLNNGRTRVDPMPYLKR